MQPTTDSSGHPVPAASGGPANEGELASAGQKRVGVALAPDQLSSDSDTDRPEANRLEANRLEVNRRDAEGCDRGVVSSGGGVDRGERIQGAAGRVKGSRGDSAKQESGKKFGSKTQSKGGAGQTEAGVNRVPKWPPNKGPQDVEEKHRSEGFLGASQFDQAAYPSQFSGAGNAGDDDFGDDELGEEERGAYGLTREAWSDDEVGIAERLERCQEIVGHRFADLELLRSALTHASGATHRLGSNERLEFLGDSILGLVVCQWLYEEYPEYTEGDLTKIKSSVVSRRVCGKVACDLGLDQCLIVGKGIHLGRSFPKSLVSDVFEAVVAGIYLDAGMDVVRSKLRLWLAAEVRSAVDGRGSGNYKSLLQQYAQREHASTPHYRLVTESGPDHRKRFRVTAVIGGDEFQPAWGNNKKDAEQHAAANALAILHQEPPPFE
jgi:ribonuclease-3